MKWFSNSSASSPCDNIHLAGYSVLTGWEVIEVQALPPGTSAQAAELNALTSFCILASGKVIIIYTDSRFTFGVAYEQLGLRHLQSFYLEDHYSIKLWPFRGLCKFANRLCINARLSTGYSIC